MSGWSSKAEAVEVLKVSMEMAYLEREESLPANHKAYNLAGVIRDYLVPAYGGWYPVEHDQETFVGILRKHLRKGWSVSTQDRDRATLKYELEVLKMNLIGRLYSDSATTYEDCVTVMEDALGVTRRVLGALEEDRQVLK